MPHPNRSASGNRIIRETGSNHNPSMHCDKYSMRVLHSAEAYWGKMTAFRWLVGCIAIVKLIHPTPLLSIKQEPGQVR